MPDLLAGSTTAALDTTPTVQALGPTSFDTTITTFGVTGTTGYADTAVVFMAPTTGRVKIHLAARMTNVSTSGTLVSPETRAGGTVGAGAVIEAASDGNGISNYGAAFSRLGACHLLTGLTPGATYNTRLLHRTTAAANTGSIALRELIVEAAL